MSRNELQGKRSGIATVVICFVMFTSSLMAQTYGTGGLIGTVADPSAAVVPNATITATDAATGLVRTATSNAARSYNISLLPPGEYRVKF